MLSKVNQKIDLKIFGGVFVAGLTLGSLLIYIKKLREELSAHKKYSCLKPKGSVKELIGKTPILKLESLSSLTECDIYVKLEN